MSTSVSTPSKKPLIGLSVDASTDPSYSDYAWYALRQNYCDSIVKVGGVPVLIPQIIDLIETYMSLVDGLIITGGNFDHAPELYGETIIHPTTKLNPKRSAFDYALTKSALEHRRPFLGICAGHQMLNIVRGGTLIQSIEDEFETTLNHSQEACRHQPTHDIEILTGSLLWECNQRQSHAGVNTSHHQAIKKLGSKLVASAWSEDGLIEAVEDPSLPFCMGVQWHPEFLVCDLDLALYEKFISVCRQGQ